MQRLVDSLAAGSGGSVSAVAADGRPLKRPRTALTAGAAGQAMADAGPQLDLSRLDTLSSSQLQRWGATSSF
jgi:hypothetical protein